MQKSDITEIYPLSFMQQTLLLHSLHEEKDQGFLQIQCRLNGPMNAALFKEAFDKTFRRHKALRTSIHWENISKPVQVVHKDFVIPWSELDWTHHDPPKHELLLVDLLAEDRSEKFDFTKVPVSRIFFIRLRKDMYFLIWTCHHVLVDGWSSFHALSEILKYYNELVKGQLTDSTEYPSYIDHLKWVKDQDNTKAKDFWSRRFEDIDKACAVMNSSERSKTSSKYGSKTIRLSEDQSVMLKRFSQQNSLSLNVLFQGLWSILLGSYLERDDVIYGITTNGRTGTGISRAEEIVGMFMNVLPIRAKVKSDSTFLVLLKEIQSFQHKAVEFEYLDLMEILKVSNISATTALFDTLFIFQNFPEFKMAGGGVEITDCKSNVTSTYPLTFIVTPSDPIIVSIKFNNGIDPNVVEEFHENLIKLIDMLEGKELISLFQMRNSATFSKGYPLGRKKVDGSIELHRQDEGSHRNEMQLKIENKRRGVVDYVAPNNDIESALCQLWEEVFGLYPIGVKENFFDLGGTSLMAIVLFDKIERRFKRELSITLLMVYPTIEELAQAIEKDSMEKAGESVICLKKSKSKKSIFCLHSTGGQILFYHHFISHLKKNISVYGIQANKHSVKFLESNDIEGLANYYIQEIRKIQPDGPYAILSYCNTNSIAMEMAQHLLRAGHEVAPLIIIDAKPVGIELESLNRAEKLKLYLKWMLRGEFDFIFRWFGIRKKGLDRKNESLTLLERNDPYRKVGKFEDLLKKSNLNHRMKPYEGEIFYVQSNELRRQDVLKRIQKTWNKITNGKMETYTFDGDHVSFFRENNGEKFANLIESIIAGDEEISA